MTEKQEGVMAKAVAASRAFHALYETPKIFDDPLAAALFSPEELAETFESWASLLQYTAPELAATHPDPQTARAWAVQRGNAPLTLSRSRFAEDALEDALRRGVCQYVLLGAGLDTFAYRRPDLAGRLEVFSVDHPATQALMRERVAAAGWSHPANLHYVTTDFTRESLAEALGRSPYDPNQPTFFSWLGVSYYLTREVVFETLRGIVSTSARGSELVFDYFDVDAFDPQKSSKRMQQMVWMADHLGEPLKAGFDPVALDRDLEPLGLRLEDNLDPATIEARYFQGRVDHYHAFEHAHFARAEVIAR